MAASIQEFGFKVPIIIDENNVIVAGHTRYRASQKLGLEEVPCIVSDDLTEAQVKAFRIADNKVSEFATWDEELLALELEQLSDMDFDLSFTGFEMDELESLLNFDDGSETEVTEDEYEVELPAEPKAKLGDIYQLGRHRLMCGDSTNKDDVARLMNGEKADMVFTDPPYGINVVKNNKVGADFGIAQKGNYSEIIADDTTDTAEQSFKVMQELSNKQIIWGGNYFVKFLPFSDSWLIWNKRGFTDIRNTFADGEMAWCSFHTPVRIYNQLWNGMIREGEKEKRVHPTQKPVKMLGDVLNDFSKENEIILDVFGGSGSTLIACEQLNRTCYMMELDPKYVDVIIDRWEQLTGEKAEKLNVEVA